jgi:transposase
MKLELKEVPMRIVGGLDVHRAQITFDYVDLATGDQERGVIRPATRTEFRAFLEHFGNKEGAFALEGTTGWRFVVEELRRAGMEPHLAEPAETSFQRGPKRRAKTDRADARLLRDLLLMGRLPESWIPTDHIAELRTTVRLRKALIDERTAWLARIRAQLFHHGLPIAPDLMTYVGRQWLDEAELPAAARQVLDAGCRMVDRIDDEISEIDRELATIARRLPGCEVLQREWGVGHVLSVTILAELGDTRRFSSSRQAVRFAGLDVTVRASDTKRARGHLSRQGSPLLRWALYQAAGGAWRTRSPDHAYYLETKKRLGATQARLSVARRMLRRMHHQLVQAGETVFADAA